MNASLIIHFVAPKENCWRNPWARSEIHHAMVFGVDRLFLYPGVALDRDGHVFFSAGQSVFRCDAKTGLLSLVAGRGTAGWSGDGGPAVSAELKGPSGIAFDPDGRLYIADPSNHVVRRVADGLITTVAGIGLPGYSGDGGPASGARLYYPESVAVDGAGVLYIADRFNSRIRKVVDGVITTAAGTGTAGFSGDGGPAVSAQLARPAGLALDWAGNLYVSEYDNEGNCRVRKIAAGLITTVAGAGPRGLSGDGGPATSAQLQGPSGLAVDSAGDLYIADNNRIRRVSGGIIRTIAGNGGLRNAAEGEAATTALIFPASLAVDPVNGHLYIADRAFNRIRRVSRGIITTVAGGGLAAGDGGPATSAQVYPAGVAVSPAGDLYISDYQDLRIRRVSAGQITTVGGQGQETGPYVLRNGDNGPAVSARFQYPTRLAADSAGNLYVADVTRIRKISNGTITTVAGGDGFSGATNDNIPATSARITVSAIALDPAGNIHFIDGDRIRKVTGGIITTVGGGGSDTSDGVPATAAKLYPNGLAVDADGGIYFTEASAERVRKIAGGVVSTVAGGGNRFAHEMEATNAYLGTLGSVAVDSSGTLYIAGTSFIYRMSGGIITVVAGGGSERSADGIPARSAWLEPTYRDIAVGPDGTIYFTDLSSGRVRMLTPVTVQEPSK